MENKPNQLPRTLIGELPEAAGQQVRVCGWVQTIRTHGKIVFFDLRDTSGMVQAVFVPKNPDSGPVRDVRPEWILSVTGTVQNRPASMANDKIPTGKIELFIEDIEKLSKAETLPFGIDGGGYDISEEKRLKYRYIDLKRSRLHKNLIFRHRVYNYIRNFLTAQSFIEIDTPYMTKSTPEGARDYLVPARVEPGNFYALAQSPQQYKQLLMAAGMERYFQIARCFRDEDTRGDRQPEFTQLDLEMSFAGQEEIMDLNEELLIGLVKELAPEKKIQEIPFPRISYKESMKKYGTDRPDLRADKNDHNSLAFCWIIDWPFFEKTPEGGWTFTHNPFSAPMPEFAQDLENKINIPNILATQYDIVLNGSEIGGGSIRNHQAFALEAVFSIMGYSPERIQEGFGHMLEAFSYGAPPHGGIAWGLDRLIMILENEPSIRETIAFPKTGDGRDLMMGAPSAVDSMQLKEAGISAIKKESSALVQKSSAIKILDGKPIS